MKQTQFSMTIVFIFQPLLIDIIHQLIKVLFELFPSVILFSFKFIFTDIYLIHFNNLIPMYLFCHLSHVRNYLNLLDSMILLLCTFNSVHLPHLINDHQVAFYLLREEKKLTLNCPLRLRLTLFLMTRR